MASAAPALVPPHVPIPEKRLGRLAFFAAMVRNPLEVLPRAVYEQDFVVAGKAMRPRVWVTSPALVKSVLLDNKDKYGKLTQIRLLSPLLGKGLLTSEGAEWKWQRQAAAPLFRPQELSAFVPSFVRAAEGTLARWRVAVPGTIHAVDDDMTRATFDVIADTLLPSADERFAAIVRDCIRSLQRFGGWDILYAQMNMPRWVPKPGMLTSRHVVTTLRSAVMQVARERRAAAPGDDLFARLIAARDPETGRAMDDEQIVDNLLTFYLAGHETTAKALTWTLYLLARSPEWTARVRDEIEAVTGGAPVKAEHIDRLALTQQVVKESMRLYPPVPIMSRQAVLDTTLGEHRIAAGTSVLMPIYAIHRHEARWEKPAEFDPGRFATEREVKMPRYHYMPFGAGPRICIGMPFAMMEAVAITASLVRGARFEWAGREEPVPVARVTLMPKGGMPMKISVA